MASKFICKCGEVVRTNLYEGHGLHLLVSEHLTDLPSDRPDSEELLDQLVRESSIVATCPRCGTIAIIDKHYNIKLYAPTSQ